MAGPTHHWYLKNDLAHEWLTTQGQGQPHAVLERWFVRPTNTNPTSSSMSGIPPLINGGMLSSPVVLRPATTRRPGR
ncbi:hypothetical protein [Pseudomonas sp. LB3P14]